MKIASIIDAIKAKQYSGTEVAFRLIHLGQHYDKNMSRSYLCELDIPIPDIDLCAGGGNQAEQTASIMIGYEKVLQDKKSDLCMAVAYAKRLAV